MSCINTGHCCRLIIMPITKKKFLAVLRRKNSESAFIDENWNMLSVKQALEIRPELRFCTKPVLNKKTFFTCKQFDSLTNKCRNYDKRPKICSGYPYYGNMNKSAKELRVHLDCGYLQAHPDGAEFIKRHKKVYAAVEKIEKI